MAQREKGIIGNPGYCDEDRPFWARGMHVVEAMEELTRESDERAARVAAQNARNELVADMRRLAWMQDDDDH